MQTLIIRIIILCISLTITACANTGEQRTEVVQKKPNLTEASDLNTRLAIGYIKEKQYKAAKEKLEKAIDQNPENLQAYKMLAYLYALLGLDEEAETKYDEALEIKPDDSDLLNSYGAFLCARGRYDEAQDALKESYSNPFYDSVFLAESNAGSCYLKQGEYKKAEALLRKSLRVRPDLAGSLISMAEVGLKTERYLMARAYIQRYHAVSAPTPESLWIQIQAEKALGAEDFYMKYARQLINDFPDSDEAGWVEAQARNERLRK